MPNKKFLILLVAILVTVSCTQNVVQGGFDESAVVLSVGVVSDVHINTGLPVTSQKWESALNQLSVKALETDNDGLDGVLVAGDLIDYPNDPAIQEFKRVYESVLDPVKTPLIYTVGNHDVPNYKWSETMVGDAEYIRKALGDNYFQTDVDVEAGTSLECRHCVVGDYDIVAISPDGTSPVVYDPKALEWLDKTLSEITSKEPSKYVILITHPMIYDTVYGSLLGEADGIWKSYSPGYWATRELPEILSKYPQVVAFGGHLHFPLNDPRSIWQGAFTALGCGSVRYMAIEAGGYENMAGQTTMKDKDEFSQGHLVQFDKKGNMMIHRMDFYNKAVIGEPIIIPRPSTNGKHLDGYSFALREAANEPPTLSSMDVVFEKSPESWKKSDPGYFSVSFSAGADDEFVHDYVLTLSKDDEIIMSKKILADFYKSPQPSMMKQVWKENLTLFDLIKSDDWAGQEQFEPGTYTVSLTAFDSWDAASETLSKEVVI